MNLLSAATLSTQKKAYSQLKVPCGIVSRPQYVIHVEEVDESSYKFQLFHITYPEENNGKWGKPHKAEKPHFEKQYSLEELKSFLEVREWDINEGWQPLEDE